MTVYGILRRVDCAEAEVSLASGVVLVYRLDPRKAPVLRNLIEVDRRPRVPINAYTLSRVRRGIIDAIVAHRQKFHLPTPLRVVPLGPREYQLTLKF